MTKLEILLEEAKDTLEPVLGEVIDFLRFLKAKQERKSESYLFSRSAFKDWLSPEEDEAWQDLQELAETPPGSQSVVDTGTGAAKR